jgi:ATP-dependent Clp protease ATP-binding subunit ClpC
MNPEFLNRLDDIIVFHPLNKEDIKQIVDIMLKDVLKRLKDKGMDVVISDAAKELMVEKGYNPMYGARPLRRSIQSLLEDPLAEKILEGALKGAKNIDVDREKDKDVLVFNAK